MTKITGGERDKPIPCNTGDSPGAMHLLTYAVGGGNHRRDENGIVIADSYKDTNITVIDENAPIIFVESPQTNTIPTVKMSSDNEHATFDITGQTLDTQGCGTVDFVWVPDSTTTDMNKKATLARQWLYSDENSGYVNNHTEGWSTDKKMYMWSATRNNRMLGDTTIDENGSGWKKQKFTIKDFDLFESFIAADSKNTNEMGNDKFFAILATREAEVGKDIIATYSEYVLNSDMTPPIIVIESPSVDGAVYNDNEDISIEYYAYKASGLAINVSAYKAQCYVNKPGTLDEKEYKNFNDITYIEKQSGKVVTAPNGVNTTTQKFNIEHTNIAQSTGRDTLIGNAGKFPVFQFYAEDVMGNSTTVNRSIGFGDVPFLKSITSKHPSGKTFGIDEVIEFDALFSGSSDITGDYNDVKLCLLGIVNDKDISTNPDGVRYATAMQKIDDVTGEVKKTGATITFGYKVQDGDYTTTPSGKVTVGMLSGSSVVALQDNHSPFKFDNGAAITSGNPVNCDTLRVEKVVTNMTGSKKKEFHVEGIRPKFKDIVVSSAGNVYQGATYNGVGKLLEATLTMDKLCYVTGKPELKLIVTDGGSSNSMTLAFQSSKTITQGSKQVTEITFQGECTRGSPNGLLTVNDNKGEWLSEHDLGLIVDKYNNSVVDPSISIKYINDKIGNPTVLSTTSKIYLDTVAPGSPAISYSTMQYDSSDKTYYSNKDVTFTLTKNGASEPTQILYSTDGGSSFTQKTNYNETTGSVTLSEDNTYKVCAKQVDIAGNESPITDIRSIEIAKGFPAITLLCTNANGNYGAGSNLNFTVTFSRKVSGSVNNAKISFTANGGTKIVQLTNKQQTSVSGVEQLKFQYTVGNSDEFDLNIPQGAVSLMGLSDKYGNSWSASDKSSACQRDGNNGTGKVHCDGIPPTVTRISHAAGNSRSVTIYFSEAVNKGSGNLTLRETSGWVIPSVLSVSDFNTVYNNTPSEMKNYLIQSDSGGSNIIDEEIDGTDGVETPELKYHGTGLGVGPYIKTTHGLKISGGSYIPDPATKYVLHFDFDPASTSDNNKVDCKQTAGSKLGNTVTIKQVREALEQAGYNKRIIDVTSASVVLSSDKISCTVTFPASLTGLSDLQKGREWEVLLYKGSFCDETGNNFGSDKADSVNKNDGIKVGSNFESGGVEQPIIRVERYSYGLGIYQPDSRGVKSRINDECTSSPTGYVRVRLDSPTRGAACYYNTLRDTNRFVTKEKDGGSGSGTWNNVVGDGKNGTGKFQFLCSKSADIPSASYPSASTASTRYSNTFVLNGFGDNHKIASSKQYIAAVANKNSVTSDLSREGVFCTVMLFSRPMRNTRRPEDPYTAYGINGTTSLESQGENVQVSGFPLQPKRSGSPFVRRCYWNGEYGHGGFSNNNQNDAHYWQTSDNGDDNQEFYWVSFEVVCEAFVSPRGRDWGTCDGPLYYGNYSKLVAAKTWYTWWNNFYGY